MKAIYTAVMAKLKEQVPTLKWLDLDTGQIDKQTERPAVPFPCAFIGITMNKCEDLYGKTQLCHTQISVRIAQNPPVSRTNSEAPEEVRESALEQYNLINNIYKALQGFETNNFNPLSRTRQNKENRADGLFVYRIDFNTELEDESAENA